MNGVAGAASESSHEVYDELSGAPARRWKPFLSKHFAGAWASSFFASHDGAAFERSHEKGARSMSNSAADK